MELFVLYAENFKLDGGACFGVVPKSMWSKEISADENNMIDVPNRILLIKDEDKLILIDTGIGNKQDEKFQSYTYITGQDNLEKSFKESGFKFEEVTDVIFTHLHFDHVGGAVIFNKDKTKTELTFKNANYWCSEAQWVWATVNPNDREKASFFDINLKSLAKSGKLKLIEEETYFTKKIFLKIFNGHTKGQIVPVIKYKEKTIIFAADFIPSVMHIPIPYIPAYDIQPLVSMTEKETFLVEALNNQYILFFEHDFYHECCNLQMTAKGIRAKDTFKLKMII